jgi:Flp pilus assembly protein TadD
MAAEQAIKIALGHYQSGRFAEAESICRQILAQQPGHLDALNLLSVLAAQAGRLDSAIELLGRAIAVNPNVADYHSNLGGLQQQVGRLDQAAVSLRRALSLQPNHAVAHYNLGLIFAQQGMFEQAIAAHRQALKLQPDMVLALIALGNALTRVRQFEQAGHAYRRAIQLKSDSVEAHWNYALLQLRMGDFERGWEEHEWRWHVRSSEFSPPQSFAQPLWNGGDLRGKTILLHAEQAFGDTLQFARYVPLVAQRGGRVVLQTYPELVRVLKGLQGAEEIVGRGTPLPGFGVHCPLLSLPRLFSTRLNTIPRQVPYLRAEPQLVEQWNRRLEPYRGQFKVGLVWAGRQAQMDGGDRSIALAQLAPLSRIGVDVFFSLQMGSPAGQAPPPGMNLIDWTGDLRDFADTAALIANLDLIISVDTAVAHLAGAMGKPVWVLLLYVSDWRWLLNRDDSPWYPTMRLFRQRAIGDWTTAIGALAEKLKAEISRPTAPSLRSADWRESSRSQSHPDAPDRTA